MGGIVTDNEVFRSIPFYYRRYQRLHPDGPRQRRAAIRLGGARKLKIVFRFKLPTATPLLRLLAWVKNAYVEALLSLAGGDGRPARAALGAARSSGEALWGKRMPREREVKRRGSVDFERRMMAHIYKAIVEPELPCCRH
ncbi:hypothetical protein ZIOFF_069742 [Zingiber officinale]|uniref:Uncharacterized protein n=1 Tax=Zingiber officinale TaxID=94328 RepID=A0A8J5ED06_ZINOF|nr:hypothetical protein ZIOFF_069742 [Zingiber officinale]